MAAATLRSSSSCSKSGPEGQDQQEEREGPPPGGPPANPLLGALLPDHRLRPLVAAGPGQTPQPRRGREGNRAQRRTTGAAAGHPGRGTASALAPRRGAEGLGSSHLSRGHRRLHIIEGLWPVAGDLAEPLQRTQQSTGTAAQDFESRGLGVDRGAREAGCPTPSPTSSSIPGSPSLQAGAAPTFGEKAWRGWR